MSQTSAVPKGSRRQRGRGGRRVSPGRSCTHTHGLEFLLLEVSHRTLGPPAVWLSTPLSQLVFLTKPVQSSLRRTASSALGWALGRTGLRGLGTTQFFHQMRSDGPEQTHAPAVEHPQGLPGRVTPSAAASGEPLRGDKRMPGARGPGGVPRALQGGSLHKARGGILLFRGGGRERI